MLLAPVCVYSTCYHLDDFRGLLFNRRMSLPNPTHACSQVSTNRDLSRKEPPYLAVPWPFDSSAVHNYHWLEEREREYR